MNEISVLAWPGGGSLDHEPFAERRGAELKRQLIEASVRAMVAVRSMGARFLYPEPLINVVTDPARPERAVAAEHHDGQVEAWDMLTGLEPDLGGSLAFSTSWA